MNTRYYIDERCGCIAVRDRVTTPSPDQYPGLHSETPGVVKFWMGENMLHGWQVTDAMKSEAMELCRKMNESPTPEKLSAAAPDMFAALQAQFILEDKHANCEECEGEGEPETCEKCFPYADDARLKMRAAMTHFDMKGNPPAATYIELVNALRAANSILWMAEKYAEAGGSGGQEMVDYSEAAPIIESAWKKANGK